MTEPFIAHSEISNEIYIICGRNKYPVTEQVVSAMKATGRLNERPHGEWTKESAIDYLTETGWLPEHDRILTDRPHGEWKELDSIVAKAKCSVCGGVTVTELGEPHFCPNCGIPMRREGVEK